MAQPKKWKYGRNSKKVLSYAEELREGPNLYI
jgi:hypothetical protein